MADKEVTKTEGRRTGALIIYLLGCLLLYSGLVGTWTLLYGQDRTVDENMSFARAPNGMDDNCKLDYICLKDSDDVVKDYYDIYFNIVVGTIVITAVMIWLFITDPTVKGFFEKLAIISSFMLLTLASTVFIITFSAVFGGKNMMEKEIDGVQRQVYCALASDYDGAIGTLRGMWGIMAVAPLVSLLGVWFMSKKEKRYRLSLIENQN